MKKFINQPKAFVDEMLEGILMAHPDQLAFASGDRRCIIRAGAPVKGKVGIATGGGSGHLPLFLGYVGNGLLDGCAVGDVFSLPARSNDRTSQGHRRRRAWSTSTGTTAATS